MPSALTIIACVAGAWKWWAKERTGTLDGDTRQLPLPSRVSSSRSRFFLPPLLPSACYIGYNNNNLLVFLGAGSCPFRLAFIKQLVVAISFHFVLLYVFGLCLCLIAIHSMSPFHSEAGANIKQIFSGLYT